MGEVAVLEIMGHGLFRFSGSPGAKLGLSSMQAEKFSPGFASSYLFLHFGNEPGLDSFPLGAEDDLKCAVELDGELLKHSMRLEQLRSRGGHTSISWAFLWGVVEP